MNKVLVDNWNNTVRQKDTVYFLGDLAVRPSPKSWLRLLNGHIIFIKGNHDSIGVHHVVLNGNMLVHNPHDIRDSWKGWIIHGHVHNAAPFIDKVHKRVNVSVEATGYIPIDLTKLEKRLAAIKRDKANIIISN